MIGGTERSMRHARCDHSRRLRGEAAKGDGCVRSAEARSSKLASPDACADLAPQGDGESARRVLSCPRGDGYSIRCLDLLLAATPASAQTVEQFYKAAPSI